MQKKILIIYATYGSGHKAIANYIKEYFINQDSNLEIKMIDMLDYSNKFGAISKKLSENIMLKHPVIWNLFFKISNHKITSKIYNKITMNWFKLKKLESLVSKFSPDLVISTHFYGSILTRNLNKNKIINSKLITIITDYGVNNVWFEHYSGKDYFIVASKEEKKCLLKSVSKDSIKVFGIPIFPKTIEPNEISKIKLRLGINNKYPVCVCFAGGGNGSTATLPYIKRMLKNKWDFNYIFISGNNPKAYHRINKMIKKYKVSNCYLYGYVNNVPEMLMISDFVITKPGGAQTTECLYFNKPMIFIKSSGGQENYNIDYFVKKGYARFFKNQRKLCKYLKRESKNMLDINKMRNKLENTDNTKAMKELYDFAKSLLR